MCLSGPKFKLDHGDHRRPYTTDATTEDCLMPCILEFEDKVYFDTADDAYHAAANLRMFLNLEGELKVNEDTGAASIGGSQVLFTYVKATTLVIDLDDYMRS